MKTIPNCVVVGLVAALLPASVFAQGSLTPPGGAPAPTMKTLSQIESRTPISSGPFTISAPGSYYLTANVSVSTGNAITINMSNVTLDLNGYTISSTQNPAASGAAMFINAGFSNITILNGNVNSGVGFSGGTYSGTGFAYGISFAGSGPNNVRVRGVAVFGVLTNGIDLGFSGTTVEECMVTTAGSYGIFADSVSNSTARNTGNSAILANNALNCTGNSNNNHGVQATTAMNCRGSSTGPGHGVSANSAMNCYGTATGAGAGVNADVATNCRGQAVSSSGILAHTATGCEGTSTAGEGVTADNANGCQGTSSSATGVRASKIANNCQGMSTSGRGLWASYPTACHGISTSGLGLVGDFVANGCYGKTSGANTYGMQAPIAINCVAEYSGSSASAFALNASEMAVNSAGYNHFNTIKGILTTTANSCTGTGVTATNKYNMP